MFDRDLFFRYASGVNLETGAMLTYYAFNEVVPRQNHKIFNSLYSTGENFLSGEILDSDKYAGYSLGSGNFPVSGEFTGAGYLDRKIFDGSGYFDGSDLIKIGHNVDLDSWTMFFNYSGANEILGAGTAIGKEKVLFSSCGSPTGLSGFSIGVLDNKFISLKNYNETGRNSLTLPAQYPGQNLVSISRSFGTKYNVLGLHNVYENKHHYSTFTDPSFKKSNQWHLGSHSGVNTYDSTLLHRATGFRGYIDDFVLFSGDLSNVKKESLSKFFGLTGYAYAQTGLVSGYFSGVTGVSVISGVIGQEVSGYTNKIVQTITDRSNKTINIYAKVPVYSPVSGQLRVYTTGSAYVQTTGIVIPEKLSYSSDYLKRYSFNAINFSKANASNSIVEFRSSNTGIENVNLTPSIIEDKSFVINEEAANGKFNVFVSGYYKSPKASDIIDAGALFSSYGASGSDGLQTGTFEFLDVMSGQAYTFDPTGAYSSSVVARDPSGVVAVGLNDSIHSEWVQNKTPIEITPKTNKLIFFHKTPPSIAYRFSSFPIKLTPVYSHDYEVGGSGSFSSVSSFGSDSDKILVDLPSSSRVLYHNFTGHSNGPHTIFSGSGYVNKDVYLDGLKLGSGYDHDTFGGKFRLKKAVPGAGNKDLFFVPRAYENFITGSGVLQANKVAFNAQYNKIPQAETKAPLLDEQFWRAGKREKEDADYEKVLRNGMFYSPTGLVSTVTTDDNHVFSGIATGFFNTLLTSVQDNSV